MGLTIAITLDGKTAYVAATDGTVSPIRTATNTLAVSSGWE
jgi:DNA-binding beta-propeller fold protein YncE